MKKKTLFLKFFAFYASVPKFFPPLSIFFNSFPRLKSSNQSKVYGDFFILLQAIRFIGSDLVNRPTCAEVAFGDFSCVVEYSGT